MTKKHNSWEEIPLYEGLVALMIDTYKSRKKNWNELPIILYFIHYNKCIEAGWLSRIVSSKTTLFSLLSFFFYGTNRSHIFLEASGSTINNNNNGNDNKRFVPDLLLFESCLSEEKLSKEVTDWLLEVVRKSYNDTDTKQHRLINVLSEENGTINRQLLNLANKEI